MSLKVYKSNQVSNFYANNRIYKETHLLSIDVDYPYGEAVCNNMIDFVLKSDHDLEIRKLKNDNDDLEKQYAAANNEAKEYCDEIFELSAKLKSAHDVNQELQDELNESNGIIKRTHDLKYPDSTDYTIRLELRNQKLEQERYKYREMLQDRIEKYLSKNYQSGTFKSEVLNLFAAVINENR
jgi:chromosome segregation ATPase